jgi:hypothetical protein
MDVYKGKTTPDEAVSRFRRDALAYSYVPILLENRFSEAAHALTDGFVYIRFDDYEHKYSETEVTIKRWSVMTNDLSFVRTVRFSDIQQRPGRFNRLTSKEAAE